MLYREKDVLAQLDKDLNNHEKCKSLITDEQLEILYTILTERIKPSCFKRDENRWILKETICYSLLEKWGISKEKIKTIDSNNFTHLMNSDAETCLNYLRVLAMKNLWLQAKKDWTISENELFLYFDYDLEQITDMNHEGDRKIMVIYYPQEDDEIDAGLHFEFAYCEAVRARSNSTDEDIFRDAIKNGKIENV